MVEAIRETLIGQPDPRPYSDQLCRAAEFLSAYGMPPIYAADKCVQQDAGEPQSVRGPALRALQFRSRASDAALYARDGRWRHGSAMVGRGTYQFGFGLNGRLQ
jgi:hypothetical protein